MGSWSWLWQGLIANAVSAVLILLAGIAVGWLRSRESASMATAILMGLGAAALALWLIIGVRLLFFQTADTAAAGSASPEAMKRTIKQWIDGLGFWNQMAEHPDATFVFVIRPHDVTVHLWNPVKHPGVIALRAGVNMASDWAALRSKLTGAEQAVFLTQLREKLLLMGMAYRNLEGDLANVFVEDAVAFGAALTPVELFQRVLTIEQAVKLIFVHFEGEEAKAGLKPGR